MYEIEYNREAVVNYARRWALKRNLTYYDFEKIGGDCTNFVSQCIYAGAKIMNYTPITGWYYRSLLDRSASWSDVDYLYKFLINNKSVGPYAHIVSKSEANPGDIIQFGRRSGDFYHSCVITSVNLTILVASHTYDALDKPLSHYNYEVARFLHIDGVRKW